MTIKLLLNQQMLLRKIKKLLLIKQKPIKKLLLTKQKPIKKPLLMPKKQQKLIKHQ